MTQNDINKDKQDILNKVLYNYIGYHYVQNINQDIESNISSIETIEIPKSMDRWFIKFNRNFKNIERNNKYKNSMKNIISKVALIFLIFAISATVLTVTVDAFRVKILNLIIDKNQEYIDIKVIEEVNLDNINSDMYYQPEYIPDGFELSYINDLGDTKIITYINEDNEEILFNQSPNETNFKIDSEGAIVSTIDIDGREAILLSKEGTNTLFWYNEENSFYLLSTVNHEELILMAKSIIKK